MPKMVKRAQCFFTDHTSACTCRCDAECQLSFRELGIWYMLGKGCLRDRPPAGTESLRVFSSMCSHYAAVIKLNCEYHSMLSPLSPSSKSPGMGVGLEDPGPTQGGRH